MRNNFWNRHMRYTCRYDPSRELFLKNDNKTIRYCTDYLRGVTTYVSKACELRHESHTPVVNIEIIIIFAPYIYRGLDIMNGIRFGPINIIENFCLLLFSQL